MLRDFGHPCLASLPHGSDQEGGKKKKINRRKAGKQERPLEMNMQIAASKKKVQGICGVVCRIVFLPCCHLPCGSWLDVAWIGATCAGGLSLPGQEGLTRTGVGKSVFSRLLLQRHTLEKKMQRWRVKSREGARALAGARHAEWKSPENQLPSAQHKSPNTRRVPI